MTLQLRSGWCKEAGHEKSEVRAFQPERTARAKTLRPEEQESGVARVTEESSQ